MHPDERRSPEHVAAQRVAELTADPGLFLTRFEGLHVRRARDTERIEELSGQVKAFRKVATERDRLRKKLTALQQDLERRLGSAHGALDAYRSENAQLKEDLKRVRQSRSMRVGRAILSPATALKRVFGGTGSGAQPLVIEGRPVSSESEPTPLKAVEPGAVAHVDSSKEGEQK